MRKIYVLFAAALFVGCSDDDSTPTTTGSIQGTWRLTKEWQDGTQRLLNDCKLMETYTFGTNTFTVYFDDDNGDGSAAQCDMTTVDGDYTYSNQHIVFSFDDGGAATATFNVLELSNTKLVIENSQDGLKQELVKE